MTPGSIVGVAHTHDRPVDHAAEAPTPRAPRPPKQEQERASEEIVEVAPGVIRTRFHQHMSAEQKKLNLDHRIPLKREGTTEQVADAIMMLVKNDYITGDTVTIEA